MNEKTVIQLFNEIKGLYNKCLMLFKFYKEKGYLAYPKEFEAFKLLVIGEYKKIFHVLPDEEKA